MSPSDTIATLRYLVPSGERPVYFASRGGADAALNIGARFEERQVRIRDARALDRACELNREGFCLWRQPSVVADFYQLERQQADYAAELTALVLAASGGSEVLVFDHTLRSDSPAVRGRRTTREPAGVVHNDYTDASARRRLQDLLSPTEARRRLGRRFAVVNVWRSVAGTVWNSPLACCDGRTLGRDDLVAAERRAQERTGELELVRWNPAHRWYYYPEMRADEVLLIKTFDSAPGAGASRAIHSAFDNPLAPADAPPRESIESRVLVFYA